MAAIHWKSQVSGNFNTATLWVGGAVPSSASDAILDAAGSTNYTVTSSVSNAVNSIQTAATATLSITGGQFTATVGTGAGANAGTIAVGNNTTFAAKGTINNSGRITLTSAGNNTEFLFTGNATLSGGGTIALNNNGNNTITGAAGAILTNTNNKITGAGQFGAGSLTLHNQAAGVVEALGTAQLVLNTGAATDINAGLLEGGGAGGLVISGSTVENTAAGIIEALNGSSVTLASSTLIGGTFKTAGTGVIATAAGDRGTVLDGTVTAVANQGILKLANNSSLNIKGAINQSATGQIQLASIGNNTTLLVESAGATITSGFVVLSDNSQNFVAGVLSGPRNAQVVSTLTNDATIRGAGTIGSNLELVNDASISASGTNALIIETGNALAAGSNVVTNDGTLQSVNITKATAEGGLVLDNVIIANTKGVGTLLANGLKTHVDLETATVEGGFLRTAAGGVIDTVDRGSVLDGTANAVTITGNVTLNNNTSLTVEGAINSGAVPGVLTLNSVGNNTQLVVSTLNATLTGLQVDLSDNANNSIVGTLSGPAGQLKASKLVNASTIQGAGSIGTHLAITNNKIIDATGGNALVITSGNPASAGNTLTNGALLESTNPNHLAALGGLVLSGVTIANTTKGDIEASGLHTHVDLSGATIRGGTLITLGGGVIDTVSTGNVLDGSTAAVNNQGTFTLENNTGLTLKGTINNTGTIGLASSGNNTDLIIDPAGATLSGGGAVTLSDNSQNLIFGSTAASRLVNTNDIISGAGQIGAVGSNAPGLTLVNQAAGVINAVGNNALIINVGSPAVTNSGLMEGSGAGGLTIQNSTVNNSTGGKMQANNASVVSLQSATIIGGTLNVAGTGFFQTVDTGSIFNGTSSTITNNGQIEINNNTALTVQGNLANVGTLSLQSSGNNTDLVVDVTNATLSGGGLVTLSDSPENRIYGATVGSTLTNVDNLIQGAGQIGAVGSGAQGLTLVNETAGIIEAVGNNALTIQTGAGVVTNSGLLEAGDSTATGTLAIVGSTVNNGSAGKIIANDGSAVNLASATIEGGTFSIAGSGSGVFQTTDTGSVLDGQINAVNNDAQLNLLNNTALWLQGSIDNTAAGTIALNSSGNNTDLIIDVTNVTLSGGGDVTMTDNSQNRIYGATSAATLTNVNNTITGAGQIGVGTMTLVNQTAGVIDGVGNSALTIDTGANTITNAGVIKSDGTVVINSAVANTGALEVNAGDLLQLNGAVTNSGSGRILIGAGTLEIGNANASEAVRFTTTTGTLQLDHSQTYTGAISGFTTSTGTELDLRDIGFGGATATYSGTASGGTLTVVNGLEVAHIKLTGNYLSSQFDLADDGHGGTLITDPPKTNIMSAAVARFAQASAGLGETSSGAASHATAPPSATTPLLALGRAA